MGQLIDLIGQRFGRLTVVRRTPNLGDTRARWECACDCGGSRTTSGKNLRTGITQSCGCLSSETAAAMGANPEFIEKRRDANLKHGHKRRTGMSPEYRTWLGMKRRCYDPKCKDYPGWGGRGIRVCDRWNESFEAFLADMGERPAGHTIDRIESKGHYEPGNVRWATPTEQGSEHRRSIRSVVVGGRRFPSLKAACNHFGVLPSTANERMKAGMDPALAVSLHAR